MALVVKGLTMKRPVAYLYVGKEKKEERRMNFNNFT